MSLARLAVRFSTRNAGRAPVRGCLTIAAVAVTLVAFLLLRTVSASWTDRIEQTPNDRVVVRPQAGPAATLPFRYTDEVRRLPGIRRASGGTWVGFTLPGKPGFFFESVAVDPREFIDVHTELVAPLEQKAAFIENRNGALVSAELAAEQGWALGDTLRFESPDVTGVFDLTLEGIVKSSRVGFGHNALWMHYTYYDELRPPAEKDRLTLVYAQIDDPTQSEAIARAIDIHFDGEDDATLTLNDKALNTAIVGRFGAMLEAMNLVSLLVLSVIVLILGNTIAMSTLERTRELGTLRALGFSRLHLASFVLGEAAALGLAGGVLGLALAYPLVQGPLSRYLEQEMRVPPLHVSTGDALAALVLAALLGLVAAALPALRASKLEVTGALSHVA